MKKNLIKKKSKKANLIILGQTVKSDPTILLTIKQKKHHLL